MAKIQFEIGDTFSFKNGKGVVIAENVAVVVTNLDSRSGYFVECTHIPVDALPADVTRMDWGIQMVFKGALVALGIK